MEPGRVRFEAANAGASDAVGYVGKLPVQLTIKSPRDPGSRKTTGSVRVRIQGNLYVLPFTMSSVAHEGIRAVPESLIFNLNGYEPQHSPTKEIRLLAEKEEGRIAVEKAPEFLEVTVQRLRVTLKVKKEPPLGMSCWVVTLRGATGDRVNIPVTLVHNKRIADGESEPTG